MSKEFHHVTVLLHETIDMLDVKPDGIYVDATLGGAGHSEYLLSQLSEKGHLYAFDQDQHAIDNAEKRLAPYVEKGMVTFIKDNFRNLQARLQELGVNEIDGICYDLGVSSPQLDERSRGFSYKKDAPLDMRMNQEASLTAYDVVNNYDYHDLVRIFFKYGEDKFSKQIARKIEQARAVKPIETTTELAEIIKSAKPAKELKKKGHRIFVLSNTSKVFYDLLDEQLSPLKELLDGFVLSCDIKAIKPDLAMFKEILDKYQLDPTHCVFLDDIEDNTSAAEKLGIKAYQVKKRSDVVDILKSYI